MSRTILLARPYPFLVDEMKPFLEEDGYHVHKAESDGSGLDTPGYAGAVIALASLSEVNLDPGEVLARLRAADREMPVVFAGLLPLASYEPTLKRLAERHEIPARPLGIGPGSESDPEPGSPETFVYLQRADLNEPEQRSRALALIRRHFG